MIFLVSTLAYAYVYFNSLALTLFIIAIADIVHLLNSGRVPRRVDERPTLEDYMYEYERIAFQPNVTEVALNHALVEVFARGHLNGHFQHLGIRSTITDTCPKIVYDVDSFVYLSFSDIPFLKTNLDLYYRPNYNSSIKKNLGINYFYQDTKFGKGPLSTCPNITLAKCGDTNVSF